MLNHLKTKLTELAQAAPSSLKTGLTQLERAAPSHRVIYAYLSLGHASGCFITSYPELYAPLALGYLVLAWRG